MESSISKKSLMMGKESTEESRKEMSKSPGAPSPVAKATIFCFQPLRFKDTSNSRRQSLSYSTTASLFRRVCKGMPPLQFGRLV
jgi:hypothetical protein